MYMKTQELEARWLRILETIAAPHKVCVVTGNGTSRAAIEFATGFAIVESSSVGVNEDWCGISAIFNLLYKLSVCHGEYDRDAIISFIASAWNVYPRNNVRLVDLVDEYQICIAERGKLGVVKRFAGSTPYEATLHAFEASEFWKGVEASAKFARCQAHRVTK